MSQLTYSDTLPGGRHWSMLVRRGVALELTDIAGGGNVGMVMFSALNPLERLNLPDTLKCQHTFKITAGHCLYSDMGRIFCSVIEDGHGWHDAVCGTCDADLVREKWGASTYQESRNDYLRNGRDSFLIEMAKYGLGIRDLPGNMNWFSRVTADEAGRLSLKPSPEAERSVTLRFEMDTIVCLHTCAHPLNSEKAYPRSDIRYALSRAAEPAADDVCRMACPENERGFLNNELFHLGT